VNPRSPAARRLGALQNALQARQAVLRAIRDFFQTSDFLEVETPVRIPTPALELHIDAEPSGAAFLRTSPELHMKRLLAAGYARIFQIGPCFRHGERGPLHHPEYSMLEWYRAGVDYQAILADAEALVAAAARAVRGALTVTRGRQTIDLTPPWPRLDVRTLYVQHAGWDPVAQFDDDRFHQDLVARIEPALPRDRPVVLMDYPAPAAALARLKPNQPSVAERWELYIDGVEIANAFSELTDAVEQRQRFEEWSRLRREQHRGTYPLDEDFLDALAAGMPPAGGAALGMDRLVMILGGFASLDEVLPFRD
jgi:lysyl-tRNA synthetase class 2